MDGFHIYMIILGFRLQLRWKDKKKGRNIPNFWQIPNLGGGGGRGSEEGGMVSHILPVFSVESFPYKSLKIEWRLDMSKDTSQTMPNLVF